MPFTYAIADLHGRYDLLSEAVTKIVEQSKSDRPATIITLGDATGTPAPSRRANLRYRYTLSIPTTQLGHLLRARRAATRPPCQEG